MKKRNGWVGPASRARPPAMSLWADRHPQYDAPAPHPALRAVLVGS